MYSETENSNLKQNKPWFIQSICTYGSILGILPSCYTKSNVGKRNSKISRFYSLFLVLIILVIYTYSINGRSVDSYPKFPSGTLLFTDFILSLLLTITNIVSIIIPLFIRQETFCSFLKLFFSYNDFTKRINCTPYYIIFIIGHIVLFAVFCYDYYVWFYLVAIYKYRYYSFRLLQNYYVFMTVFIIHLFVYTLKQRFKAINELLESMLSIYVPSFNLHRPKTFHLCYVRTTRQASQLYVMLAQQVSLFNDGYGWQMLVLAATIVTHFLNSMDVLILYGVFQKETDVTGLLSELIILTICWFFVQLVRIFGLDKDRSVLSRNTNKQVQ